MNPGVFRPAARGWRRRLAWAALAVLVLPACGSSPASLAHQDGRGSGSARWAEPRSESRPESRPGPRPVSHSAAATPSAVLVEAEVLRLVNRYRRDHGLLGLVPDPELTLVARNHSAAMRDLGFFDHRDPDGYGLTHRLRRQGVIFRAAGENLAAAFGEPDPADHLHRVLVASTPHRTNLLRPQFTRVGIGVARRGSRYWLTEVFVRHMP